MDWYSCSKTFVKVVDEKGFAAAARKLHTTQSSISKRIAWLENMLDTQLLTRTTRRINLTEAGEKYYNQVNPLIDEWDELKLGFLHETKSVKGSLTVAVPTVGGNHYVPQVIPTFMRQYPDINLVMLLTNRVVDLMEEKIDLYVGGENMSKISSNASEKISGPCRRMFASPNYLAKYGEPTSLDSLAEHSCLIHTACFNNMWQFDSTQAAVNGKLRSNNVDMLIKAAMADLGIIFVVESFVAKEVERQRLQVILPEYHSSPITLYASYPSHKYIPKKTQAFIKLLKHHLGDWSDHFPSG